MDANGCHETKLNPQSYKRVSKPFPEDGRDGAAASGARQMRPRRRQCGEEEKIVQDRIMNEKTNSQNKQNVRAPPKNCI